MRARPLLSAALIAIALPSLAGVEAAERGQATHDPLRLERDVIPTFQEIRLTLDAERPDYTGSVHIELEIQKKVRSFRFHAEEMKLEKIELRRAGKTIPIESEAGPIGLITLNASEPLPKGSYTLDIEFSNDLGTRGVGLYRMEQDGLRYIFTQFEAEDAREAFPCWDEPGFKLPYRMTLVVPEGHLAISNSPVEKETSAAGVRTLVFKKTPPLPSYLLAVATGPLEIADIPGLSIPGRVVTVKGQRHLTALAAEMAPPILEALEAWFDSKYPFEKLDLIAIPEYWFGAMENPGAITFASAILLLDARGASTAERRTLASVLAHELAHMWFGDVVTMSWWDDLWLNESFADWLGSKITDQVHPQLGEGLAELNDVQSIMASDSRPSSQAIHRRVLTTDHKFENLATAYNKGNAVLGMFERWVGPEKFRRGVRDYVRAHAWRNATAADLWEALAKGSDHDVSTAMATFLEQSGVPLVSLENLPDGRIRLTQERFKSHGTSLEPRRWKIPVALRYPDGAATRVQSVLLGEPEQVVAIEGGRRPEWIFPDAGGAGYYRWSLPAETLQLLAARSTELLSERERIAFLGNLSGLLDSGSVRGDEFLRLLAAFIADPSPTVVEAALGALGRVKRALVPDELTVPFAAYVRRTLAPAAARFGVTRRPGEPEGVTLLRPKLMEWLGDEGRDEATLSQAREIARSYGKDPASVDAALAGTALKLAALGGDRALFEDYRGRLEKAAAPAERSRYLLALGSFTDPKLADAALRYALEGPLRPNEIAQVAVGVDATAALRDQRFEWVTRNYPAIAARIPPEFAAYIPTLASGCEAGRMESAREFFSLAEHRAPGTDTTLAKVSDQVDECVRLREREGRAVAAFLRTFTESGS